MEMTSNAPQPTDDAVTFVRRREVTNRRIEAYFWMITSLVVAGGIFVDVLLRRASLPEVISVRYAEFLLAFATFFFPFVFRLIFGALPLESIRRKRAQRRLEAPERPAEPQTSTEIREAEIRILSDALSTDDLASSPATKLFAYYASSSRRLSQSIYSRAGVWGR